MGASFAEPNLSAAFIEESTGGLGADAVLITASTKSNAPIEAAANSVRQKGRVVLVGVVGLEIDRRPFYFKEAEFVVSCSYGPGRYDPAYEQHGHDYPAAWVRWTEQRNIQSVLDLMGTGRLDVAPLISHRFGIDEAANAYELINSGDEPFLGVVLKYPEVQTAIPDVPERRIDLKPTASSKNQLRIGVLGAGNFARMVMLPAITACSEFVPAAICTAKGVTGTHEAATVGFERSVTDEDEIFGDTSINTVFSLTRHDQHASHVLRAIDAGKNIFVEKPLCLTADELAAITAAVEAAGDECPLIMTGFNRRFAPATVKVHEYLRDVSGPLTVAIRFNAGSLPEDHWSQHDAVGGGRLIGEACHAIDLATCLTGSVPIRVFAESVALPEPGQISDDRCFITLRHANGSISSIGYLAGGDKGYPKERIEVFGGERVAVIDDFSRVELSQNGRQKSESMTQDKGHRAEMRALAAAITSGSSAPITWSEIHAVSTAAIAAVMSLREGVPIDLGGGIAKSS